MNINVEIFKRYQPEKKLALIEALSESELLMLSSASIIRIIKEVGRGSSSRERSHNKDLKLLTSVSNHWNADVEGFTYYKKVLYIEIYLQYSNTDTFTSDTFANFDKMNPYRGSYKWRDMYDNPQTTYFTFDADDKARVYKQLLITYIKKKYKDILNKS